MNSNSHFSHPPQVLAICSLLSVSVTFITCDSSYKWKQCLPFCVWLTLVTIMYSRLIILPKQQSFLHLKAHNTPLYWHIYIAMSMYAIFSLFCYLLMDILVGFFLCLI